MNAKRKLDDRQLTSELSHSSFAEVRASGNMAKVDATPSMRRPVSVTKTSRPVQRYSDATATSETSRPPSVSYAPYYAPGMSINLGAKSGPSDVTNVGAEASTSAQCLQYDVGAVQQLLDTLPINEELLEEEDEMRALEEGVQSARGGKMAPTVGRDMPRIRPRRRLDMLATRLDTLNDTYKKICEIEEKKLLCMQQRNEICQKMLNVLESRKSSR